MRMFASLSFSVLTSLYLAIVVYAPSLALAQVSFHNHGEGLFLVESAY